MVSVIIPSYNRYEALCRAVASVLGQTHTDLEVIVVDDCSTEPAYGDADFGDRVGLIRLPVRSRDLPGDSNPRNSGIEMALGTHIAFLDDDDVWLPHKLEAQLTAMDRSGCRMSSTDGFIGYGPYDSGASYPRYNADRYLRTIADIHRRKRSGMMRGGFPSVWTRRFLKVHNSVIASSVVMRRDVALQTGHFKPLGAGDDYDFWLRALKYTDCAYVEEPCVYYDNGHAGAQHLRDGAN
jgi:glycosyltransferase involved in cell wall biosynthesis